MNTPTMRSLGDILAEPATRSGVHAVLDIADAQRDKLSEAQWRASFAPVVRSAAFCPCGATYQDCTEWLELTDDELQAAADDLADAQGTPPIELHRELAAVVINAVNVQRARAAYDDMRNWEEIHDYCTEAI